MRSCGRSLLIRSLFSPVLLAAGLFLCFCVPTLFAWTTLDNFESHKWYNPYYNDGWDRQMNPVWGTYHGRACLKLTGPTNGVYEPIVTNYFPGENWSNVSQIKVDIYPEVGALTTVAKLEVRAQDNGLIVPAAALALSSTDQWMTCSWNYAVPSSSPVARLSLIFDQLGSLNATFYADNLRLVLNDGTTHYWDDFDDAGLTWGSYGSTGTWSASPESVSHNASTSTANGGAGCLWWRHGATDPAFAEFRPAGVNVDWRANTVIRADVRCTTPTIPVTVYLWYGTWGQETEPRYVSQANTWQTLYWPLPSGTTNNNVQGVNLRVSPSILMPSGTCYIDNIMAGNVTPLTIVKSTGAAGVRPDGTVTVTFTYANPGTEDATTAYLTDVIPVNAFIASAAAVGSADTVEYYVGSSWTGTYSAAATRIRWRDDLIAAGESNRTVSYTLQLR